MITVSFLLKNILAIIFVVLCLKFFTDYKIKINKILLPVCLVFIFGGTVVLSLVFSRRDAKDFCDALTALSFALIPYFVFRRQKMIMFALFGSIVNAIIDYIAESINYTLEINDVTQMNFVYCVVLAVGIVAELILYRLNKFNTSAAELEEIPVIVWLGMFVLCFSSYYMLELSRDSSFSSRGSIALRMTSGFIIIICLIFLAVRYTSVIRQKINLQFQIQAEMQRYKTYQQYNRDLKSFRHDYKNQMIALYSLLESGNIEQAKQFISDMNGSISSAGIDISTGNYLADAIISYKAEQIQKSGISIKFKGTIPAEKVSNNDLTVILSNLLDNAIRGCEGCAPCTINIESVESADGVIITVSNPVIENIDTTKKLTTTKKDRENHGLGISNIKKIAKKYHGFVKFECSNKIFSAEVILMT